MATWKKLILEGSNISELTNDSGFITSTSGALSTSGGTLTGNLGIPNKITHNDDTGTYFAFTDGQIDLKGSGGVRMMLSDNEAMYFYTGSSTTQALYLDTSQNATFGGDITVSKDDGFVYLNNAGTGNDGVYVRGLSTDHMRYHVPATKTFHWEIGGVQKAQINTSGLQIGDAGNDTSTSLRVNTGIMIHKDSGTAGNDVSITFDRRNDGAYAYIKATAGDDGAYATNLQFITKGHNGSAYQTYTGLTIDDEGSVLIQGNTRLTSEGSTKRLKLHGSGDNYVLTGCYDDNGWGYLNSYNNANGMQFYIDAGIYSFRNGKMMIGVESSGTATSANLFIIGANNAGDGIKIARGGDSQNALDQYAQLNMNQGTTNLISRGGTSGEGTIALQTTSDGSTHTNRLFVNSNGNIAIGTDYTSPDTLLHIHKATAGSISAHSDAQLAIENDGVTAINLLSATTSHGQILFGDSGDADKGVFGYDQSTDKMYIRVNGSSDKTFVVNSTGTGINTDSPAYVCEIKSSGTSSYPFVVSNSSNTDVFMVYEDGSGNAGAYVKDASGNTKARMLSSGNSFFTGGNLGIGDADPTEGKLVVSGVGTAGEPALHVQISRSDQFNHFTNMMNPSLASGENAIIVFGLEASTKNSAWIGYKHRSNAGDDNQLSLGFWGANNLVNLLPNGNLGIGGEEAPIAKCHIFTGDSGHTGSPDVGADELLIEGSGDAGLSIWTPADKKGGIYFSRAGQNTSGSINYHHVNDGRGSNSMIFTTASTTALTIDGNQKVGINTQYPDQTLHVFRGSAGTVDAISSSGIVLEDDTSVFMQFLSPNNADVGLVFGDPDDNDIGGIFYEHANNKLAFRTNTATALSIDSQGNMGLGIVPDTTWLSTRTAFQIGGGGSIFGRTSAGADADLSIGVNVYQHSGGSYRRLDEDVTTLYRQYLGCHEFKVAGSSTDNSTISYTDALKINNDANIGIGRTALGTAYGVGASSILEIGTSASNTAGTVELVGNTNGADVAIGNILWRNEYNYYASGVNYWGGSGEGVARIQVSNVQGSSTGGEQGSEMTFWTKAFGGDCAKRLSLSSVGLATFTGDVKIAKASGSSTLSFVPATSQSSQIKFYQDDGSTQEARIFAPEGSKDLAFEAGIVEMMRMTETDATVGGDLIINGRTKTSHTYLKIQSNADNNYDAILQWDAEDTMAWQLYNDGSDSDKLKLKDAGGTQIFEIAQDTHTVTANTAWSFQSHIISGDIYLSGGDIYGNTHALCITLSEDDVTFADDVAVSGDLTVDGAYPFMINASADWKGTSSELNMPFTENGTTTASPSTASDLKTQMTWVAPFATTLRAMYVTSETAVTNAQFKVEVAGTYSVFVNGTSTTTTTYTKSCTTGGSTNIACGLSIAKGNALRFSINPNSTAVDQFLVTFVFE